MLTIKKKVRVTKQTQEQEIATIMNKVTTVLLAYKKQVVIAVLLLIALLVITGGYSLMRSGDERKARSLLTTAYESYSSSGYSPADYGKALELFRGVQNKYSGTMSAAISQYYAGNCLANLGQAEEALKEYQAFVNTYSGKKFLLKLVYQRMGYVYVMLGKQAEAIKAFEQSDAIGDPGVATIELARLYEASGNIPESQKKYKIVKEKLVGSTWSVEAMGKTQAIEPASKPVAEKAGK
ncbi:MAG: tetratricopeptide repeat protein [Nitrospirae bacterium]|nr:tetratricopeptide repeat protein [Nitrospirota bacterium]